MGCANWHITESGAPDMRYRSKDSSDDETGVPLPRASTASNARWTGNSNDQRQGLAPPVVDIALTGQCQLRCNFCWGPEHEESQRVAVTQWKRLLDRLACDGLRRVVFTGGEPLLFRGLDELLRACRSLGVMTTLSSNGILLSRQAHLLRHTDHLGIPIDSSSVDHADEMRPRSARHGAWFKAIEAMRLAQEAGVALIIRTVVTQKNVAEVARIPFVLQSCGVDLQGPRVLYKLYQVTPSGPIATSIPKDEWAREWAVSGDTVEEVAQSIRRNFPELTVATQLYEHTDGRYFIIDPRGDSYGNSFDKSSEFSTAWFGNVFSDYDASLASYWRTRIS